MIPVLVDFRKTFRENIKQINTEAYIIKIMLYTLKENTGYNDVNLRLQIYLQDERKAE